jgi:hypothetical protein
MSDDKAGRLLRQKRFVATSNLGPSHDQTDVLFRIGSVTETVHMKLSERIKEAGAAGYILLWLLGVPIPILFVIFLLRGCS